MQRRRLLGVAIVGAAGIGALAVFRQRDTGAPAGARATASTPLEFTAADVVTLIERPVAVQLAMPGTVQALAQATVRSKISAEVRAVRVREGEKVAVGQVLVEFDTAALRAQLAERVAALESARATLAQAERTRQVNAQLVKQNFISQNAFDSADAAFRAQAAAVEAAQAQLAQTQLLLDDAVVRAPIGGHIARRHVQPGEKVGFDAPLLAIVDLSRLEVQAQAAVSDVARIVPGARASVAIEGIADRQFDGRVERINPSAEPGTRSINVFVSLPDQGTLLRTGMFAKVFLQVGDERPVPVLPLAAVRHGNGEDYVWVLADGRVRKRTLRLGRREERGQWVEVRDGVAAGEPVIAIRIDDLRDGRAASLRTEPPAAGADPRRAAPTGSGS